MGRGPVGVLAAEWEDGLGTEAMRRLIGVSLLLRLSAVAFALFWLLSGQPTPGFVLGAAVLAGVSLAGIWHEGALVRVLVRHPILLMADVFLGMSLVAVVGVQNPLVLATLPTAFIVGLLFPLRVGGLIIAVMVGGYVVVAARGPDPRGFVNVTVIPLMYVSLYAVGDTFRRVTAEQVDFWRALARAQTASSAANERARLAREMHDSLAKTLHGIAIGAGALPAWVERDPRRAVAEARQLADGAERAAAEGRAILVRMRADQPDRPLAEILGELCASWSAAHHVPCEFSARDLADLRHDARYELAVIATEALENVARHADASLVRVSLRRSGDVVRLTLQDNGIGFRSDHPPPRGRFGLTGMRERAESVGGRLEVVSRPGEGATVMVELGEVEGR